MTDILFTANGASATVLVSGEMTSGMVGLPVRFSFDSDWNGLNIVAVFDGGGQRISVPLLTDMEAVLPWEVIAKANTRLRIGAEGRKSDGSIVIPTVWANAGYILEGAAATDDEGNPPTPSIYDQIMAAIEAGKLQGKPGEDGVSPTVSVTEIEGGHRVTITDEKGKQVFDVMDGKDASVSIVDNLGSSDPNAALSARMGGVLKTKIEDDVSTLNERLQPQINQRVKTVNGVAPDENGNVNVEGGGMSATASALLITILRNGVYSTDQSANITALAAALGGSGGGDIPDIPDVPDEPEPIIYTITAELVNVTSSNSTASVTEGESYNAKLTAADGYELDSVAVTMGGVDVTADVYADGVISIPAVTGNVEIVASATESEVKAPELITDGLLDYFDFRTAEYNNTSTGSKTTINSNIGNGWTYAWANNVVTEQSNYGIKKTTRAMLYSSDSTTTQTALGTAFTWVFKSYSTEVRNPFSSTDYSKFSNLRKLDWTPKYKTASGTSQVTAVGYGERKAGYACVIITVDGSIARLYFESELIAETDGSTIDGFVSWYDMLNANTLGSADPYMTQLAVYNRALSEVEITETVEYLASLEVE